MKVTNDSLNLDHTGAVRAWLLIVLVSVFDFHVRFSSGCGAMPWALTSMSQARRAWLLFALGPVFDFHVRFGFGGWRAVLPGVPGAAPASTRPVCVSFRIAGTVVAGQLGAGSMQSRFQQVMKASFQASPG